MNLSALRAHEVLGEMKSILVVQSGAGLFQRKRLSMWMDLKKMGMSRFALPFVVLVSAMLFGCGGSGTAAAPEFKVPRQPPAESSYETVPDGPRIDLRSSNYFAYAKGDYWDYSLWDANGRDTGMVRITAAAEGVLGATSAEALERTFDFEQYPQPFYPVGGVRTVVRSGGWGEDLDGDGTQEGFHFTFNQVFRGTESFAIGGTTVTAVHFTHTTTTEIIPSDTDYLPLKLIVKQELWFAPGYNLVKFEEEVLDGDGAVVWPWEQWRIFEANVAGHLLSEHLLDAKRTVVDLEHKRLIYDPLRQQYIASLPPSFNGGGLALVSPSSGQVLQVTSLAGEPGPLWLSPAGDALYVALDATGELLKLSPDTLAVLSRTPSGGARVLDLAISPVDPKRLVLSVTDMCLGCSGGSVRLVQLDDMLPLPKVSSSPHYNFPLLAFDPSGSQIYSFNNLSTGAEFAVHDVTATGVQLRRWVADYFGDGSAMWVDDNHLILDRNTYSLPDFSHRWSMPRNVTNCVKVRTGRTVCTDFSREEAIYGQGVHRFVLMDATTGQVLARPSFANAFWKSSRPVTGAPGQMALSIKDYSYGEIYPQIWLFRVDDLLK